MGLGFLIGVENWDIGFWFRFLISSALHGMMGSYVENALPFPIGHLFWRSIYWYGCWEQSSRLRIRDLLSVLMFL